MTDTTDTASLKKQIETAADIIRDLTDQLEAATALAHSIEEARCNNFSKSGAQFWSDPRIITLTTQLIECFDLDLQDLMTSGERQDEDR